MPTGWRKMRGAVSVPEWGGILLLFFLVLASLVTVMASHESSPVTEKKRGKPAAKEWSVEVRGEVAHPGLYKIEKGMRLGEVLERAEPTPLADMRKVRKNRYLRPGEEITLASLPMIEVLVVGAVEESTSVVVPHGSSVGEVLARVKLQEGADTRRLTSRRKVRDGEVIDVRWKKGGRDCCRREDYP